MQQTNGFFSATSVLGPRGRLLDRLKTGRIKQETIAENQSVIRFGVDRKYLKEKR